MPGPPPTPTAVRNLQGNPGRRPLNAEEPVTPALSITPPDWMEGDEEATEFWHSVGNILRQMNVAMESDRMAMELLSMCLAEARRAYKKVQEDGSTCYTTQGGEQPSAHFKNMSKMVAQAMGIMKEFGMTPASRSRVKSLATGKQKSKLASFMEGSG